VGHFTVTGDRITRRAQFFLEMGNKQVGSQSIRNGGIKISIATAQVLAEAYFLLSESYKSYRSEGEHKTANPKIAAMTCAAICALNPLRPPKADFGVLEIRYANPMFAMRCASAIIEHPWHTRSFEERRRTYDELTTLQFPCLDKFIQDVSSGRKRPLEDYNTKTDKFSIGLTFPEIARIESLINRFVVYQELKIYASKQIIPAPS
jgi:hypothetical protein